MTAVAGAHGGGCEPVGGPPHPEGRGPVADRLGLRAWFELAVRFARLPTLILVYLHMLFFALCLGSFTVDAQLVVKVAAAVVAMTLCYTNATAVNDLSDEATDAINLAGDPDRPLVAGVAGRGSVVRVAVVTGAACLAASLAVSWWAALVTGVMLLLNVVYSMPPTRLSSRGALAQALLPLEYCVYPAVLMVFACGGFTWTYAAVVASMYLIFVGRLFLKDIRDEVGDRATGKLTFVVRHSKHAAIVQSAFWTITGTLALSVVMFLGLDANPAFVFGFCALSLAGQVTALVQCDREPDVARARLYTGVYGRWISMKVFFYVMVITLARSNTSVMVESVVLGLVVLLVVTNVFTLYDNLARQRRAGAETGA